MSKSKILWMVLATVAGFAGEAQAQQPRAPQQVLTAKRLFILNAGGEEDTAKRWTGRIKFQGGPDRAYNQFFTAMKSWGRFELVQAPAGADLVFEIEYADLFLWERVRPPRVHVPSDGTHRRDLSPGFLEQVERPQVSLTIRDPKTLETLWTFTETIGAAGLQSNRNKNFDRSVSALVKDARKWMGEPKRTVFLPKDPTAAPLPPQIAAATNVLVRNAGTQSDPVYDQFFATLKSWGRYTLVSDVVEADLVFELSFDGSQLRLRIIDPGTRIGLWGMTKDVDPTRSTTDQNLHQGIATLVTDIVRIAGQPDATISVPPIAPAAPLPPQLLAAKTVFLSHPDPKSVDADIQANNQVYDQVSAAIQSWGRYRLGPTAADADLILEPTADGERVNLTFLNPQTGDLIWRFTEGVKGAFLIGTERKNVKAAMTALTDRVRKAVAGPIPPAT